jgi:hypothetical protein
MVPAMKAFIELKTHVGNGIGNRGPAASIVAKKYAEKVPASVTDKVERFKQAKKLFDQDSEANKQKYLEQAIQDLKNRPRKPRKSKKKSAEAE